MKLIAVNGGPRKTWNTGTVLKHALEGAQEAGAEVETFHLYDLQYQGCTSCLACKRKGYARPGQCAMRDGLTPLLEAVQTCDALILASPIYIGNVTGAMRSLMERLLFAPLTYTPDYGSVFQGKVHSLSIYTMGVPENLMVQQNYPVLFESYRQRLTMLGGTSEVLTVNDTFQFEDYSRYVSSRFDPEHKARVKAEQFPLDCQKAFEKGKELVERARKEKLTN